MAKRSDITVTVFFAEDDPASVRTLDAIEDCLARCGAAFHVELQRVNQGTNRDVFEDNDVHGVPVVDLKVSSGRKRRLYGERSAAEIEAAICGLSSSAVTTPRRREDGQ